MIPLLLLLAPLAAAAPSPTKAPKYASGMPRGVRAGPDATWEVSRGPRLSTLRYRADGQLVGLGPAWEAPLPGEGQWAVAEGGGNVATLGPDALVVIGKTPCTLRLPKPKGASITAGSQTVYPIPPAEGPFGLAVDSTRAVLVEHEGVLLVDLRRCAPVATAGLERWKSTAPVAIVGDELLAVEGTDSLTFHHLRLPDLARLPDVVVESRGLLAAPGGPALVLSSGLVSGSGWRPFDSALPVAANGAFAYALDLGGRVTRWDAEGRKVDESAPGGATSLRLLSDPGGTITVGEDELRVRFPDPGARAWSVSEVGDTRVAQRGDQVAGVPIPGTRGSAGVSPDGRVMVTAMDKELVAWRLRDGARLWTVPGFGAAVTVGDTWIAVRAESAAGGWRFYDPVGGAPLGELDDLGVFTLGDQESVYTPGLLHGHPWSEEALGAAPATMPAPSAPTLAWPEPTRADTCRDPVAALARLTAYPRVFNARRAELSRCPAPKRSAPAPEPVAKPQPGASWAWTAPAPLTGLWEVGEGRVAWTATGWVGALGPDGALLWARQTAAQAGVRGGVFVLDDHHRFTGLDLRTGAELWTRGLETLTVPTAKVAARAVGGDRVVLDLQTGVARREPQTDPGIAFGYRCDADGCVTELRAGWHSHTEVDGVAAREEDRALVLTTARGELARLPGLTLVKPAPGGFLARHRADPRGWVFVGVDGKTLRELGSAEVVAASPTRSWLATGATLVAQGGAAPATTASPAITFAAAPVSPSALPPEQPVVTLPAVAPPAPTTVAPRLVDSIEGAVLLQGETPAWTAPGRWALGLAGDVAVVADPLGDVEGRAVANGRVLWHAPIPAATVRRGALTAPVDAPEGASPSGGVVGGALGGGRARTTALYDGATGRPVGTWSSVSGCLFPGGRRLCLVSTGSGHTVVGEKGEVLGPVPSGDLAQAVTFGELVVVRTGSTVSALRAGRVVWSVESAPSGELRALEGKLVVVSQTEARFADPGTGRLIDVVSFKP